MIKELKERVKYYTEITKGSKLEVFRN